MAEMPLWLNATLGHRDDGECVMEVTLARCRNCGKPKVTSDPCSLDHLAALMEFGAQRAASQASSGVCCPVHTTEELLFTREGQEFEYLICPACVTQAAVEGSSTTDGGDEGV